jgi:Lon protease-like protein
MNLPDQVAVMPLPNAVLFPRVMLPLYIFEARYKLMLADCLKGDRMFAVALLRPDQSAQPCQIASVGVIRTCVGRPDGTANLILEGIARVQIVDYVKLRPYRVARIESLESFAEIVPPPRAELVAAVARLAKAREQLGAGLPKPVLDSLFAVESADVLSDLVSYTLLDDFHDKQQMLETLDVNTRLGKLVAILQQQIRQFELWKTLQGKLSHDDVGKN